MGVLETALLVLLGVSALYAVVTYNNLVSLKHNVAKAWANIEVLLKQRNDELSKLMETCKQYMQFERETLQRVMEARAQSQMAQAAGNLTALGQAEGALWAELRRLFAVAEAYPELKTNEDFQHLQDRITQLENSIIDRRNLYNESVNLNNVRIEQFPDAIIAGLFNFKPFELLEFPNGERRDVDIKKRFA